MKNTNSLMRYLLQTYQPEAIITYGSYADGTANENSDFDALVIAEHEKSHDSSVIDGILLDVFVYPTDMFRSAYDPEEFIPVLDGKIVLDHSGIADRLQKRVLSYTESLPKKTTDEIHQEIRWCEKMLVRTMRGDAEGDYRLHLLLVDSLEIYCDIKGLRFDGSKKALRRMEQTDREAFQRYEKALKRSERESLSEWVSCLKRMAAGA